MPLSLISVRGIMVATILDMPPEIFEKMYTDGYKFRVSDHFLHNYLHEELHWSPRRAMRAAQKLPDDWEEQCD